MAIDALLSRLAKARQSGTGRWVACCPAHDDKRPSLSIRELDDARVKAAQDGEPAVSTAVTLPLTGAWNTQPT